MNQYKVFHERFKKMTDQELIDAFNGDVGNPGWVSARANFQSALRDEFDARGFDYSAIGNSNSLSIKRRIKLVGKKIQPQQQERSKSRNYPNVFITVLLLLFLMGFLWWLFFRNSGTQTFSSIFPASPSPIANRAGCIRTEPYPMPEEFKRAISLIRQRIRENLGPPDKSRVSIGDFINCLDIQYSDLTDKNAEGYFIFNLNSSKDHLQVFVDKSYRSYDDLLTALLLTHELWHAIQLELYWSEGRDLSCVDKEVEAFETQMVFLGVLNQEELKSLVGRAFYPYLPKAQAYDGLKQLLTLKGYTNYYCGSSSTCYWNYVHQQIYNYVVNNPFYKEECNL